MVTKSAREIVLEKGRGYTNMKVYPEVVVFTTLKSEINALLRAYDGNAYEHGTGFVWILSRKKDLAAMMEQIKPYLPSKYGFESIFDTTD